MPSQRLLEEVRAVMRKLHYSIHTERSYCDWVRRFVVFHQFQSRDAMLAAGVVEIEAFLTSLALEGNVAASTQNQALNALVFLHKHVLNQGAQGVPSHTVTHISVRKKILSQRCRTASAALSRSKQPSGTP